MARDRDKERRANQAANNSSRPSAPTRSPSNSVSTVNRTPVATNPNVASTVRSIRRDTATASSLNPGSRGDRRNTTPVNNARPGETAEAPRPARTQSGLRLNPSRPTRPDTHTNRADKQTRPNKTTPERSPTKVREDKAMCKARPSDNKPKGGAGSGKTFVPWKGTKFGC